MQYLSHSQIDMFQQCQYRWYLTYRAKAPQAPSDALTLGTAFHAAVEIAGNAKRDNESLSLQQLYEIAEQSLQNVCERDTTQFLRAHLNEMQTTVHKMLFAYYHDILPRLTTATIEEKFTMSLTPQLYFTGRIDAVTARGTIVDFKTGKPWSTGAEHTKDQATAYLMIKTETKRVVFIVFPIVNNICIPQILPTERTPQQIATYRKHVIDTAQRMQTQTCTPHTGPLCAYCGVLGSCTVGQLWLKQQNKHAAVPIIHV